MHPHRENIRARVFHRRGNARFFRAKKTHEETRLASLYVAINETMPGFIRDIISFVLS